MRQINFIVDRSLLKEEKTKQQEEIFMTKTYQVKRNNVLYFRKVIPVTLRKKFRAREIKYSLRGLDSETIPDKCALLNEKLTLLFVKASKGHMGISSLRSSVKKTCEEVLYGKSQSQKAKPDEPAMLEITGKDSEVAGEGIVKCECPMMKNLYLTLVEVCQQILKQVGPARTEPPEAPFNHPYSQRQGSKVTLGKLLKEYVKEKKVQLSYTAAAVKVRTICFFRRNYPLRKKLSPLN